MKFFLSIIFFWLSTLTITGSYRLPTSVIPINYNLKILTYLGEPNNFAYDGKVWIRVKCHQGTHNITLHSKDLNITDSQISVKEISTCTPKKVKIASVVLDQDNEFLIINLSEQLKKNHEYEVFIPFRGEMVEGLDGFYRSSYVNDKTNETKWLGVTHFEAISARKAFPCFDEPGIKAVFEITLGRKQGYSSISNMPILSSEPIPEKKGWFWDKYQPTLPMSTYLVAFIVSDFDYSLSEHSRNNVTFRIWGRKSVLNQINFAKEVGPKSLEYYEDFFNIKFPLPKTDMVAIPDFISAMENWGLVNFREKFLLYDPNSSSLRDKNIIATAVAHELAHQWFGNLVTMKWWTDLWLKEGFATYMATRAVGHLFPQWKSMEEDAVNGALTVFTLDSLNFSHPVSVPIGHPDEIGEIFDAISYEKGSFLIRMMTLFLGDETLKSGVSKYLKKYEYKNADQNDLWESLTEEAHRTGALPRNLTVKTVMDKWTLQTGYPLVTITRDYTNNKLTITQERYFKNQFQNKSEDTCWWVPLSYTDSEKRDFNGTKPSFWLSCPKQPLVIDHQLNEETWILFNIKMGSLYRVNYDQRNWNLILQFLNSENHAAIPVLDKVQLINNAFDLASTDHLKYDIWFNLIKYLQHEDEYLPWKTALENFKYLYIQLMKTQLFEDFKTYLKRLVAPTYERLGGLNVPADRLDKLASITHQKNIADLACLLGVSNCISEAQDLFKKYQNNPNDTTIIPNDLRPVVYCTAIRNGGEQEWNFLWEQYQKTNVASEKNTIQYGLACTKNEQLLRRYLDWSVQENSGIKKQESANVFASIIEQTDGYHIARNFLFTRIKDIYNHLSQTLSGLSGYISSLKSITTTREELEELENFLNENQEYVKDMKQEIQQTVETAKLNVQWKQRYLQDMERLLRMSNQLGPL